MTLPPSTPRETADLARNERVTARYDELIHEGKHGHYETLYRIVQEETDLSRREAAEEMRVWRCFHCDEVFTDRDEAADHFGVQIDGLAEDCACKLTQDQKGIVHMLREAWDELRSYHQEETRLIHEVEVIVSRHTVALRNEEEKGYERGLRDGPALPTSPESNKT